MGNAVGGIDEHLGNEAFGVGVHAREVESLTGDCRSSLVGFRSLSYSEFGLNIAHAECNDSRATRFHTFVFSNINSYSGCAFCTRSGSHSAPRSVACSGPIACRGDGNGLAACHVGERECLFAEFEHIVGIYRVFGNRIVESEVNFIHAEVERKTGVANRTALVGGVGGAFERESDDAVLSGGNIRNHFVVADIIAFNSTRESGNESAAAFDIAEETGALLAIFVVERVLVAHNHVDIHIIAEGSLESIGIFHRHLHIGKFAHHFAKAGDIVFRDGKLLGCVVVGGIPLCVFALLVIHFESVFAHVECYDFGHFAIKPCVDGFARLVDDFHSEIAHINTGAAFEHLLAIEDRNRKGGCFE